MKSLRTNKDAMKETQIYTRNTKRLNVDGFSTMAPAFILQFDNHAC